MRLKAFPSLMPPCSFSGPMHRPVYDCLQYAKTDLGD